MRHHAIALRPECGEAQVNLGNVLFCQGKLDEAIAYFQTAVRVYPNNAIALCSLGTALSSMNKYSEVMANYQAALVLNPNFVEV